MNDSNEFSFNRSVPHILVVPSDSGDSPIYLCINADTSDRSIASIEMRVAAICRELFERSGDPLEAASVIASVRAAGLTVFPVAATATRPWDAMHASSVDTWLVHVPADADHELAGAVLVGDPRPWPEPFSCGLRTGNGLYVLATDRPYRLPAAARQSAEASVGEAVLAAVYEQVPLGRLELHTAQFGTSSTSLQRALKAMTDAGFDVVIVE